jgi:hypothetical protein
MELRKKVIEDLIKYYRTSGCDRYGQLGVISEGQIARTDEEKEVLNEIVNVGLYGYTYGTYRGFSPWGNFKDSEVERMCREAFQQNKGRLNMNNW